MPIFDEKRVKICGGHIVWDGITAPENENGELKYSLKAVFPPHCPDLALLDGIAQRALAESKWRGQLPPGASLPILPVAEGKYQDLYRGWFQVSFKTKFRPDIFDENGAPIDAMQVAQVVYTGQQVDVLAHAYSYDHKGKQGISCGLDAFAVILSAQAPKQNFGANFGGAFGAPQPLAAGYAAQGAPAAPAPAPAYGAPATPAPAPAYGAPAAPAPAAPAPAPAAPAYGAPAAPAAPAYGAPAAPAYGAPAAPAAPAYGAPADPQSPAAGYAAPTQQAPGAQPATSPSSAPAQAHNFLPQQ